MFGAVVLDVALGLVLSFLLLSLILTSLQEGIESLFKGRAMDLERAIGELLDKGAAPNIVKNFYDHPLISSLFPGPYKKGAGNLPSYIPGANFAAAVSDIANKVPFALPGTQAVGNPATPTQRIIDAYATASQLTGGGTANPLKGLEAWYDSAMDRLSGKYKRKTQMWLFCMGLLIAAFGNIDPIRIAEHIAKDQKLGANVVALAATIQNEAKNAPKPVPDMPKAEAKEDAKKDPTNTTPGISTGSKTAAANDAANNISPAVAKQIQAQLAAGLPVGWEKDKSLFNPPDDINWNKAIVGWLIAALAGMLGAPFWFDQLNRIMNLRGALKPEAKK